MEEKGNGEKGAVLGETGSGPLFLGLRNLCSEKMKKEGAAVA